MQKVVRLQWIAVEVYAGNTSGPKTVSDQVTKLRQHSDLNV